MFYSIKGKMIYKDPEFVVLETGGIGFHLLVSLNTFSSLPAVGEEVMLFTYLQVREDAMTLYGFSRTEEKRCFELATSVSGVGPKAGMALLSEMTPEQFSLAIAAGDEKTLRRAPGIGPKTAARVILELRDKVETSDISAGVTQSVSGINSSSDAISEAMNALISLGYSQSEAAAAVSKLDTDMKVEELIKAALKKLS